ncbi:hypothetical protein BHE74_00034312 [Ensete ventricosum]|nr:hypothetical protein GW17_00009337 [Ensete ventricosum]RWW58792.1 hypothetical protein BHE74_00034312 [Ensete ventricosum]RZS14295.1 hypothetical protein BHM03_00045970 [Ensete ventricosum]
MSSAPWYLTRGLPLSSISVDLNVLRSIPPDKSELKARPLTKLQRKLSVRRFRSSISEGRGERGRGEEEDRGAEEGGEIGIH